MPSRISGACNGCRTKKQKCSGDRSGCVQCAAAGIQCTWPEQRKRGPAKGYIEGLEHRLHEAESLLLALLPVVTTSQLQNATHSLNDNTSGGAGHTSRDSISPSPRNARSSPPVLNKKTGIDYWESFPLDSVDNIRRWQQDCAVHSQISQQERSASIRNSGDALHNYNSHSRHNSRPSSMDLQRDTFDASITSHHRRSHSHSQPGQRRTISSDTYRSGTTTPVNITSAARQSPLSHPQHQHQSQNWQNLSLYSQIPTPATSNASPATNIISTSTNNASTTNTIGAEALLLQSFADTTWAQQDPMNANMGMTSTFNHPVESGPMEIDMGFFSNDLQRRLFW